MASARVLLLDWIEKRHWISKFMHRIQRERFRIQQATEATREHLVQACEHTVSQCIQKSKSSDTYIPIREHLYNDNDIYKPSLPPSNP